MFLYKACLYLLKAAVDAWFDVAASKRMTFSELARNLYTLLQQQTESRFINGACVVRHQTE